MWLPPVRNARAAGAWHLLASMAVEFRLLGSVQVWQAGARIPLGRRRERALLGLLLLEAGNVVPTDRLVDLLWDDDPPPTAVRQLRVNVSRLRRAGAAPIRTHGAGYCAEVEPDRVDAHRFAALVGQAIATPDDPAERSRVLDAALALWRGPLMADGIGDRLRQRIGSRLEELRLSAVELRAEADLAAGRPASAIPALVDLVEQHPLRERLVGLLMLALGRSGRQAEAADLFRRHRVRLAEELGVDPGTEIRAWHEEVLRDGARSTAALVPPRPRPAQLPLDIASFTGRAEHLSQLDALLLGDRSIAAPVVLTALGGTAGAGKTALAVHWGHRVRDRFPDGQLYADLRGYARAAPVRPVQVLTRFLLALGVPEEQIPVDPTAAADLYRTTLADRRVLIVLDNARVADQVRLLLPGTPGCRTLITSRDRLSGLAVREDSHRITVGPMTLLEARALLSRIVGGGRVAAEPAAADALAAACGYLPLALRIAAVHLADRPDRTVADYLAELEADRLAALRVEQDEDTAVRATLDLSWAALPEDTRGMFALLGLVPMVDVTARTAAALAGIGEPQAGRLLRQLADVHLLEPAAGDRYTMHDLVRSYAAATAGVGQPGGGDAAVARWYGHYLDLVDAAARVLYPQVLRLPGPPTTARFATAESAAEWLAAERANLFAAVLDPTPAPGELVWRLADALRGYLLLGAHLDEWHDVARAALDVARAADDLDGQVAAHLSLGSAYLTADQLPDAREHLERASELSRASGWVQAEAAALGNLGAAHSEGTQLLRFVGYVEQALALNQRTGWLEGQAVNLSNLGSAYRVLGRLGTAEDMFARAVELYRSIGSSNGAAISLGGLGETCRELGRIDRAADLLNEALRAHRGSGDRMQEAEVLRCLADVHRDAARHDEALRTATAASAMAEELGHGRFAADALNTLAMCYDRVGDPARAVEAHRRALTLASAANERYAHATAEVGLASAWRRLGRPDEAVRAARQALELAQEGTFWTLEGHALNQLAAAYLAHREYDEARGYARRALDVHVRAGHRLGQGDALLLIARTLPASDGMAAQLLRARAIFTEVGAPVGDRIDLLVAS